MESREYQVEKARAKVIWINGRPISLPFDFFGAADLICLNETGVKIVQVKSTIQKYKSGHLSEARRKLIEVRAPPESKLLHVWQKNEKGRWALTEEVVA